MAQKRSPDGGRNKSRPAINDAGVPGGGEPSADDRSRLIEGAATRFAGIAMFASDFASPDRLAELVEVLDAGDVARFQALTDPYGAFPNACGLMCHIAVEVLSTGTRAHGVNVCTIRADLTLNETYLVFKIARQFYGSPVPATDPAPETVDGVYVPGLIPSGPYLDALKAAGLVKCWNLFIPPTGVLTGAREFVCAPLCR